MTKIRQLKYFDMFYLNFVNLICFPGKLEEVDRMYQTLFVITTPFFKHPLYIAITLKSIMQFLNSFKLMSFDTGNNLSKFHFPSFKILGVRAF